MWAVGDHRAMELVGVDAGGSATSIGKRSRPSQLRLRALAARPPMVTKAILVLVLAVTAAAVGDVLRRDELDAETAAAYLLLFTGLFALRVAGQLVVLLRSPGWLPPMEEWNLLPYRLLLPIQLVFLAVMGAIVAGLFGGQGVLAEPEPGFGRFLIGVAVVYAASMVVRYAVRMRRRPAARWFGGTIPIVFHLVLAAFLVTWGSYHAQG
jgi:hypothetical protein